MTLDDGANTTCHSQQWAARAEEYLAHFGLRLDWISTKTRTFKGLGGALTKSLGKRRIPCVFPCNNQTISGVAESCELEGEGPCLLSWGGGGGGQPLG